MKCRVQGSWDTHIYQVSVEVHGVFTEVAFILKSLPWS